MEMSQQRMLRLIELSFEPIFVWQTDHGILEWNRGAEILYGYSRDEALGKHPGDLLQTHYPLPFGQLVTQLQNAMHWSGEVENIDKHGNVIAVETRYQIIRYDNETVVLETNRDLRERKRADTHGARLAAVAAASHDALYGATLAGIIEAWNPGAVALMGYTEDEAIGQNISMLAFPEQHEEQLGFLRKVSMGESVPPFDTVRRAKDGRTLQVSMAMSPVKAANGTVVGISVALHDIGERKEWDRQQRLMNKELAHRVKNSFAVLQAILHSTSPEPQKFTSAFSSRLHSMAAAHDVLTANDWRGAELRALLLQLLLHQVNSHRVRLTGPSVHLPLEYTAPLSLIFNELLTNAMKYGALSSSEGTIDISWTVQTSDDGVHFVALQWQEGGGPRISAMSTPGFGTTLIKRSLADANVTLEFKEEGLVCKMTWPMLSPRQPPV
jgi:PAS domain S-box-containing protein